MNTYKPFYSVAGRRESGLLLIADHASNHVPDDIDLQVAPDALEKHIAIDIGVEPLSRAVSARLGCPAILATISRLVVDLHREAESPGVIPLSSDGHAIPGNAMLDEQGCTARIERFWEPYHGEVVQQIDAYKPAMLFTLHSFTPVLESEPDQHRPWECGILYNQDNLAARIAIPKLEALGLTVGDNEPYSGKLLNATMNTHAESRGLPYLAIEVRNDLIADAEGVKRWTEILAPVIAETRDAVKRG